MDVYMNMKYVEVVYINIYAARNQDGRERKRERQSGWKRNKEKVCGGKGIFFPVMILRRCWGVD